MAKKIEVFLVRAFGESPGGGNPAGVVLDAETLSPAERAEIARRVGYSETAFVEREGEDSFRLQFFTPSREIANCGHATVASFFLLKHLGRVAGARAESRNATGRNEISFDGGLVLMEQPAATYEALSAADAEAALVSAGARREDLLGELLIASTGNRFLLLPLKTPRALQGLAPDMEKIAEFSRKHSLIGYYAFALTPGADEAATTRMFAPLFGISEESATGMAAGPLACALFDRFGLRESSYALAQGLCMTPPVPSRLHVRLNAEGAELKSVRIGGKALASEPRMIEL